MQQPPDSYPQYPQQQWNPQQPPMPPQQQWNPQQPPYPPQQYQQPPQYQPQMPPPKKSRKTLWIVLGVIGAIVLVSGCFICGLTTGILGSLATPSINATATTQASSSSGTSTSGSQNSSGNQVSKVGGTITLDGVQATLVSAKTHQGTEFDIPKAGNEYVVVHVSLHNTTDHEVDYNVFDFHIKSGTGNITDEAFVLFVKSSDQLNSGKLAAGGSVEGDIVFEVKKGDHQAELTWQPSFFQNAGDNGWNLGL